MTDNDPSVLEFRAQRLRRAPRNWTGWVAFFTLLNGVFLSQQQDFIIPAGLVAPFAIPGPVSHFVAAGLFGVIAYAAAKFPKMLFVGLVIYLADAIFAAVAQLWVGVVMHAVVLAFIGIALAGLRAVKACQALQTGREA